MQAKDLIGKKFWNWTVLDYGKSKNHQTYMKCLCACGNIKEVAYSNLYKEKTKSCGCIRNKLTSLRTTKHHMTNTRLFHIWDTMIQRTTNKKNSSYKNYGARGIFVCDEWKDSCSFFEWALSSGYNSKLSIDRIDNNKGYSPENCRWVDAKTQARNTRQNRFIVFNGERRCLAEWEEVLKLPKGIITNRLRRGYSEIEAITIPIQPKSARGYLRLKKIKEIILFFLCLAMCSCSYPNISQGIPCESLSLIYYEDIQPLEAEIEVLKNNAVIEEVCR